MDNLPKALQKNYKTKLCWHYTNNAFCKFGEKCVFAHGEHELLVNDTKRNTTTDIFTTQYGKSNENSSDYKTIMCKYYMNYKKCPFGSKCSFAHGELELLPSQAFFEKIYTDLANDFSIYV